MPRPKKCTLARQTNLKARESSAVTSNSRALKDAYLTKFMRENEKLKGEIEAMRGENETMRGENEALKTDIDEWKRENEKVNENLAQLETNQRSLESERSVVERKNRELRESVQKLEKQSIMYEETLKSKELELEKSKEEIQTWRTHCCNLEKLCDDMSVKLSLCEEAQMDTNVSHNEEVKKMRRDINEIKLQTPTRGSKLKPYHLLSSRSSRNDRSQRAIELITELVGSENLDNFLSSFIDYISKDARFSFRLEMSPCDALAAAVKWNLSDGFLTGFRKFTGKMLGFSVFPSLHVIRSLKRLQKPEDEYDIDLETVHRTTRTGKVVTLTSPLVRIRNLESTLIRRIETLSQSNRLVFDDSTSDEILICYGGDKGGHQTKLCAIIGNVLAPNNPRGILVLGFYDGADDHDTLKAKLSPVFHQINNLKTLKYNENGKIIEKKIKTMIVSDWKFISSVLDHPGQSSRQPCFSCHAEWTSHGSQRATLSTFPFDKAGAPRTLDEYKATGDPLIHIDPRDIPPPPYHTCSGVNQKYVVGWTIAAVNQMDYGHDELPPNLNEQIKFLKTKKQEEEMYTSRVSDLQDALADLEMATDTLIKKPASSSKRPNNGYSCSSAFCFIGRTKKDSFNQLDSFCCSICGLEFHDICSFLFKADERIRLRSSTCHECNFKCKLTMPDRLRLVKEKMKSIRGELENDLDVLLDVKEEREELENVMKKSSGPKRKELETRFSDVGANSRVHYQEMTGNMTRNFLRPTSIDHVFSMFEDSDSTRLMAEVAKDLGFIMSQSDNSVKTDDEIAEISNVIDRFYENLREAQPDATVAPKLHGLSHLVPFLEKHRTWGRVSEQGIESLHCVFNALNQRYSPVRNTHRHTTIVLQMLMNYNHLFDTGESCE